MTSERVGPLVGAGVIAALVLGGFLVLQPFLVPVAWATILAYTILPGRCTGEFEPGFGGARCGPRFS